MLKVIQLKNVGEVARYLTVQEFAAIAGYHYSYVYALTMSKKLLSYKVGRRRLIEIKEAEKYVKYRGRKSKLKVGSKMVVDQTGTLSINEKPAKTQFAVSEP